MAARGSSDVRRRREHSTIDRSAAQLAARVRELYVDGSLSTYCIAKQMGIDRQRVNRILRKAGVDVAARGRGRPRPTARTTSPTEEDLRRLYVEQRLTSPAIGRLLGIPERRVRTHLARYGIERRHRGGWDRRDRVDVDPDRIEELYVREQLSAESAGSQVGVSLQAMLRAAHYHGLPVRPGCSARSEAVPVHLLYALYDDPRVVRALAAHGVPIVRSPGTICERFPEPALLTPALLAELYLHCGLSSFQIELVTGRPAATVLRKLEAAAIVRRARGGVSPFLARWRRERSMALLEDERSVDS